VTNQELLDHEKNAAKIEKSLSQEEQASALAALIRKRFEEAKRQRTTKIDSLLLESARAYAGEYDPAKLSQIKEFGGSEVYARVTSVKCRGATALLRDIYTAQERPWGFAPSPKPVVPDSVVKVIDQLVAGEVVTAMRAGEQLDPEVIRQRRETLYDAAKKVELEKAKVEASEAELTVDDILQEGGFYYAFNEFLTDLPIFKIAVLKGPVVKNVQKLIWQDGEPTMATKPTFTWTRVSPFDIWFSPGATRIEQADVFERHRLTVQDLYDMIGVAGYDEDAIREVIRRSGENGLKEWGIAVESQRADLENRTQQGDDTCIDAIEFTGHVLGKVLKEFEVKGVDDDEKPYFVTLWLIDRHVIKVMLNPSPRKRPPYFVTSYVKLPGSLYGDGLPETISDIQDIMNATARALVNNVSISSGPQVFMNEDLIDPAVDRKLRPWKVWSFQSDPLAPNAVPLNFFQPSSNAQELLMVYEKFNTLADEISAIPRYMTGNSSVGGAGRTASGLSMLIGNANKSLQSVAENIDLDVFKPMLEQLYDYVMLTDPDGVLRGDEQIVVKGVRRVMKQESDRVRQIEFLAMTANPLDAQIIGAKRANVLQQVANNMGLDIDIPEPEEAPSMDGAGAAGPNPGGGPTPTPSASDGATPRLQTQSLNSVSKRNNVG
jgi:hypothetical protein